MSPLLRYALKLLWFFVGLALCAVGYGLVIKAGLGASPWDILQLGISGRLHVGVGRVIQVLGLAIILLNITLGIRPTVGMVLNMLTIGPMLQFVIEHLSSPSTLPQRAAVLVLGILISGFGTAWYVSADIGSGPRDGMMIGLTRILGRQLGLVKNGIDVLVSSLGYFLGGPLGIGSLVVVATLGWSMQLGMAIIEKLATYQPFAGFIRPVQLKRAAA